MNPVFWVLNSDWYRINLMPKLHHWMGPRCKQPGRAAVASQPTSWGTVTWIIFTLDCHTFWYNWVVIMSLMIVYSTVYSMRRSKKTSKLCVTDLCVGNSPATGEFPAQRASIAENVCIWWRHHVLLYFKIVFHCDACNYDTSLYRGAITCVIPIFGRTGLIGLGCHGSYWCLGNI